jgi:hypothetical protein
MFKDGHDSSIWEGLDSVARDVEVPRPVLHHDQELAGIGFDAVLPAVQWTPVKYGVPSVFIQDASHR